MRITRIQVPNFRVLHDVDLSFEQELTPQVFPLGSQNGGGKSTLLQLIFTLLHCFRDKKRVKFIRHLIAGIQLPQNSNSPTSLCKIELNHNDISMSLDFKLYSGLPSELHEDIEDKSQDFSILDSLPSIRAKVKSLGHEVNTLNKLSEQITKINRSQGKIPRREKLDFIEDDFLRSSLDSGLSKLTEKLVRRVISSRSSYDDKQIIQEIHSRSVELQSQRTELQSDLLQKQKTSEVIADWLEINQSVYICSVRKDSSDSYCSLLCHTHGVNTETDLETIADRVYLAAPSTHVFLFLDEHSKSRMFKSSSDGSSLSNYYSSLDRLKADCQALFTYDFLAVDVLIKIFQDARDRDFRHAIEFEGNYGSEYKKIIEEMNNLLSNKTIRVLPDLSGVSFEMQKNGSLVTLLPEDLSHGELKRLSLYMWLKYQVPKGSIVFMDEVEIALHPDWQYHIADDLVGWEPKNQYILATHSYELCEALTPAHVKELEPKLRKKETAQA